MVHDAISYLHSELLGSGVTKPKKRHQYNSILNEASAVPRLPWEIIFPAVDNGSYTPLHSDLSYSTYTLALQPHITSDC